MLRTISLFTLAVGFLWLPVTSHGENPSVRDQQTPPYASSRPFGTLREQAAIQQAWLRERLETNLPMVMREHGVLGPSLS